MDHKKEPKEFRTRCAPKQMPPSAQTNFRVVDDGNCSPRFMRSTLQHLPHTKEILGHCLIPMGLVVQPLASVGPNEEPIQLVDLGMSNGNAFRISSLEQAALRL